MDIASSSLLRNQFPKAHHPLLCTIQKVLHFCAIVIFLCRLHEVLHLQVAYVCNPHASNCCEIDNCLVWQGAQIQNVLYVLLGQYIPSFRNLVQVRKLWQYDSQSIENSPHPSNVRIQGYAAAVVVYQIIYEFIMQQIDLGLVGIEPYDNIVLNPVVLQGPQFVNGLVKRLSSEFHKVLQRHNVGILAGL